MVMCMVAVNESDIANILVGVSLAPGESKCATPDGRRVGTAASDSVLGSDRYPVSDRPDQSRSPPLARNMSRNTWAIHR